MGYLVLVPTEVSFGEVPLLSQNGRTQLLAPQRREAQIRNESSIPITLEVTLEFPGNDAPWLTCSFETPSMHASLTVLPESSTTVALMITPCADSDNAYIRKATVLFKTLDGQILGRIRVYASLSAASSASEPAQAPATLPGDRATERAPNATVGPTPVTPLHTPRLHQRSTAPSPHHGVTSLEWLAWALAVIFSAAFLTMIVSLFPAKPRPMVQVRVRPTRKGSFEALPGAPLYVQGRFAGRVGQPIAWEPAPGRNTMTVGIRQVKGVVMQIPNAVARVTVIGWETEMDSDGYLSGEARKTWIGSPAIWALTPDPRITWKSAENPSVPIRIPGLSPTSVLMFAWLVLSKLVDAYGRSRMWVKVGGKLFIALASFAFSAFIITRHSGPDISSLPSFLLLSATLTMVATGEGAWRTQLLAILAQVTRGSLGEIRGRKEAHSRFSHDYLERFFARSDDPI